MSDDDNDVWECLIQLGLMIYISYRTFKMLMSVGPYKEGQVIDETELPKVVELPEVKSLIMSDAAAKVYSQSYNRQYYKYCDKCGEVTGHGSCGHCTVCYGGDIGGECAMHSDD